ncbi:hypothetical protein Hamer_G022207 [Homarus americanus]|uniref:Uncharacterized protein n=1 Tax=Homarus americanus TaxID=6706 RepID=A0A8J5JLD1_HOMAM|nr:hypothetical protein Hamer_G022207 [Homarus americanus]
MSAVGRKTLSQLYRQGWAEIPEVMASSYLLLVGVGFMGAASLMYVKKNGDNKRYRFEYTVYRPDDPRIKTIRE